MYDLTLSSMENLKQQLIAKSLDFLTKHDLKDLSLRKIAASLNVTHQAPYHYFKNKNLLIDELKYHAYLDLCEQYRKMLLEEDCPFRSFQLLGIEYINLCIKNPGYYKAISSNIEMRSPTKNALKEVTKITDAIVRKVSEKSSRSIDPDNLKVTCWSSAHGFCSLYFSHQIKIKKKDLNTFIEQNTQFLTELVR
ncbi:MAG: TetR/AcrR family transcriptional regulator [Pseudobacteriovorax sp.]|nr:TetR/AcrR family transcriptional regulator [Pseudobacteriovorax sp.]